jgi:hypothetical protein
VSQITQLLPMNPAFADLRRAYAAYQPTGRSRWRGKECSVSEMLDMLSRHRDAACAERGRVLAEEIGLPWLTPRETDADALPPPMFRWWRPRLFEHATFYDLPPGRLASKPCPPGQRRAVAVVEPCMPDEDVPQALDLWAPLLGSRMSIKRLSKEWLLHDPDNPNSQIFLIGMPYLIDRL